MFDGFVWHESVCVCVREKVHACVHESVSACKHCCFVLVEMMDVVCEMMEKYSLSLQGLS